MWLNATILALVTLQRLVELMISRRNTNRLIARGAEEVAGGHYVLIVALHAVWLGGLWFLVWNRPVDWAWLFAFLVLAAARGWVIAALGEYWTTRIIVTPEEPLVTSGPYRYLRHPNYLVVACEIFILPMVFGLFWYALAFSILNAAILAWRIRAEERALRHKRQAQLPEASSGIE
ncbi:isoprenylcysteine carboxylmethyltransferase family protein [soil metagenome]